MRSFLLYLSARNQLRKSSFTETLLINTWYLQTARLAALPFKLFQDLCLLFHKRNSTKASWRAGKIPYQHISRARHLLIISSLLVPLHLIKGEVGTARKNQRALGNSATPRVFYRLVERETCRRVAAFPEPSALARCLVMAIPFKTANRPLRLLCGNHKRKRKASVSHETVQEFASLSQRRVYCSSKWLACTLHQTLQL